ncbi:uncharacterized protein LOC136079439 [Hydra vulgaris]|uniref:Uncharacterized protein LOC136079439 n=1 Tax=Hydra vulgaris TaxID=6087 RepID=A0ABM4BQ46_HYDVU
MEHLESAYKWRILEFNIKRRTGVDHLNEDLFKKEKRRWRIILKCIVKAAPSDTRWEYRFESIKAVKYQIKEISLALDELKNTYLDCETLAASLIKQIHSYEFIVLTTIWYHLLSKLHIFSQLLQRKDMAISIALQHSSAMLLSLDDFKNNFEEIIKEARESSVAINVIAQFTERPSRDTQILTSRNNECLDKSPEPSLPLPKRRVHDIPDNDIEPSEEEIEPIECCEDIDIYDLIPEIDDECNHLTITDEDKFKQYCFYKLIDIVKDSLQERFESYNSLNEIFGFLFDNKKLKTMNTNEFNANCTNLVKHLEGDIEEVEFKNELSILKYILEDNYTIIQNFQFILERNLEELYSNVCIVYRIILTIPITVAHCERSFSKLKSIENYLRSTMSQEKLSGLAILSIENAAARTIDYNDIIDEFAS